MAMREPFHAFLPALYVVCCFFLLEGRYKKEVKTCLICSHNYAYKEEEKKKHVPLRTAAIKRDR